MLPLLGAILALCLGPLLYRLARPIPATLAFLDGFTFVGICGLVLLEVLPQTFAMAGLWAVPVAILGLLGPSFTENWSRLARPAHTVALVLAVLGIFVHNLLDGMALINEQLTAAVILHRLPVGLTLWSLLRPTYGALFAAVTLLLLSATTALGYFLSDTLDLRTPGMALGLFQALVAGSLLHVVTHVTTPFSRSAQGKNRESSIGALVAFVMVVIFLHSHHHIDGAPDGGAAHNHGAFWKLFLDLAITSAPALLAGYVAAGFLHGFLPSSSYSWLGRGGHLRQSLKGMLFGLPLPICSCGVVPLYQTLIKRRVPLAAAMTFLVATPELGIDAVLLSVPLLGAELTIYRVLGAAVVALVVGIVMGLLFGKRSAALADEEVEEEAAVEGSRLQRSLHTGLVELVDATAPWIVVGIAIAALAEPALKAEYFTGDWSFWGMQIPAAQAQVVLFALLGMPTYVCASGATPMVAVLIAHGVSPGAAVAFLLTGPATNVVTFGILSKLHGRSVAIAFGATMLLLSVLLGLGINQFLPTPATTNFTHSHGQHPWWALVCAALLGALFVKSLFRQGPRGFAAQVLPHDTGSGHDHSHGGDCHDHHHH